MLRGRCACNAVAYEVSDEFVAALNCHCSNCRATTGSAFLPFGEIAREKLTVTKGEASLMVIGDADAHHAMRCGTEMYAGCWMSGISIIDVSDIKKPRTLSRYEYDPPCPEPTHTFLKVAHPIGGKRIAVSTEEERSHRGVSWQRQNVMLTAT